MNAGLRIFIGMALLTAFSVGAEEDADRAWLREQERRSATLSAPSERPAFLRPQVPLAPDDQRFIARLAEKSRQADGQRPAENAVYFVSFSLPLEGLAAMLQETRRFGIPATLRGMVNNDMRETVQRVMALVKNGGADGVQIDPQPFHTFSIQSVPALVVQCERGFDVIRGNLHIEDGLRRIAHDGDCAPVAQALLDKAGVAK
ncbi:type-F conjugative transfer system pilin assembly protein TrbC [Sodalis endosymbiont of Spalangia cameroni]|uniref:type-F conjugative transfer system pilin assembly protein TrbC n=1 Tax=Sodalis praecaptivus TaxID=1239307 RepID=UPI0031F9BDE9